MDSKRPFTKGDTVIIDWYCYFERVAGFSLSHVVEVGADFVFVEQGGPHGNKIRMTWSESKRAYTHSGLNGVSCIRPRQNKRPVKYVTADCKIRSSAPV